MFIRRILSFVLVLLSWGSASAVPGLISYQGRLTDLSGNPITVTTSVTFTFYDTETLGDQLGSSFSDTDSVTPDGNGIYSTMIGDDPVNLVPESIFDADSVWLNVNIDGEDLVPRVRITAAGYAMRAAKADVASGLDGALMIPGDRLNLGSGVWLQIAADGAVELVANGIRHRLGTQRWVHPSNRSDYISPDGSYGHDVQVALNASGDAIIVWRSDDGTNEQVFMSELWDGVWTHPSSLGDNISPDGRDTYDPKVALSDNGDAVIVWRQSDGLDSQIFMSEYRDRQWVHPADLSDNISPNGEGASDPQVAINAAGDTVIVWHQHDGAGGEKVFKSEYRAGVWSHPPDLTAGISFDGQGVRESQVALSDNGDAVIVWESSDHRIYISEYRGSTWVHPTDPGENINPPGEFAYRPALAVNASGDTVIAWEAGSQIYKSEYRGGTWVHPSGLPDCISADVGGNSTTPRVVHNGEGDALIVWQGFVGMISHVFKSEYRGGSWTHPTGPNDNISPAGQDAFLQQVALNDSGDAVIVWQQGDGADDQIFKSEYRGGTWLHPTGLTDNISPDGAPAWNPQVALNASGDAIIVWREPADIFKSEYRFGF